MLRSVGPKGRVLSSIFKISAVSTASVAVALAGCQRIPDQQRVTKLSVADIATNIRCELQEALLEEDPDYGKIYPIKVLNKNGEKVENWIYKASVSYTFDFKTEINNNLDLAFNGIWNKFRVGNRRSKIKITSNNNADYDNKRKGEDLWTASEKLGDLINADCSSVNYRMSFKYPIKGQLGLYKILYDYYRIGRSPNLRTTKYQRLLEFTILKGGTINPIYFISPVPLDRRTLEFPLTWRADRQDIHSVTLLFTLPLSFQHLVDGGDPPGPDVTLVRIVGGKDENEEPIASQVEIIGDVNVVGPGSGETEDAGEETKQDFVPGGIPEPRTRIRAPKRITVPKKRKRPYVPSAATKQRGLSPDELRRLERLQTQERQIRADEGRIR